jgi:glycogen synthase
MQGTNYKVQKLFRSPTQKLGDENQHKMICKIQAEKKQISLSLSLSDKYSSTKKHNKTEPWKDHQWKAAALSDAECEMSHGIDIASSPCTKRDRKFNEPSPQTLNPETSNVPRICT